MADYNPPDDLVELRRQFERAHDDYAQVCRDMPSGHQILAGDVISDEQRAVADAAWRRCIEATLALQHHPWWGEVDSRLKASEAVREAARRQVETAA